MTTNRYLEAFIDIDEEALSDDDIERLLEYTHYYLQARLDLIAWIKTSGAMRYPGNFHKDVMFSQRDLRLL